MQEDDDVPTEYAERKIYGWEITFKRQKSSRQHPARWVKTHSYKGRSRLYIQVNHNWMYGGGETVITIRYRNDFSHDFIRRIDNAYRLTENAPIVVSSKEESNIIMFSAHVTNLNTEEFISELRKVIYELIDKDNGEQNLVDMEQATMIIDEIGLGYGLKIYQPKRLTSYCFNAIVSNSSFFRGQKLEPYFFVLGKSLVRETIENDNIVTLQQRGPK